MKKCLIIFALAASANAGAQSYVSTSDTAAMLTPYLRKGDTASLHNRLLVAANRNLDAVLAADSVSAVSISAAAYETGLVQLASREVSLYANSSVYLINQAADLSGRNMALFLQNTTAGGGGISYYFMRHNNYDGSANNYYNILSNSMMGTQSAVNYGAPGALRVVAGKDTAIYIAADGKTGINTQQPQHSLHVKGSVGVENGLCMVGTSGSIGGTLQIKGTAQVSGKTGIGRAADTLAAEMLQVYGNLRARRVMVTQANWGDYVFNKDYPLLSTAALEQYIKQHKHLHGMPPAAEVEKEGADIGELVKMQQVKLEELTLYLIEQDKKQAAQEKQLAALRERIRGGLPGALR